MMKTAYYTSNNKMLKDLEETYRLRNTRMADFNRQIVKDSTLYRTEQPSGYKAIVIHIRSDLGIYYYIQEKRLPYQLASKLDSTKL